MESLTLPKPWWITSTVAFFLMLLLSFYFFLGGSWTTVQSSVWGQNKVQTAFIISYTIQIITVKHLYVHPWFPAALLFSDLEEDKSYCWRFLHHAGPIDTSRHTGLPCASGLAKRIKHRTCLKETLSLRIFIPVIVSLHLFTFGPKKLSDEYQNIQSLPPGHDARIDKVALVSICLGCGWISHHALVEHRNLMDGINMDPCCTYWPPSHQWDQNQRWNHGCQRSQGPRPPKLTHFPIHRRLHIQSDLSSIARLQHTIETTNKNSNRHTHTRLLNLPNKVI